MPTARAFRHPPVGILWGMADEKKPQDKTDDNDKAATQRVDDAEKRNEDVRAALKDSIKAQDKTGKK